jgi:hypothetical protein
VIGLSDCLGAHSSRLMRLARRCCLCRSAQQQRYVFFSSFYFSFILLGVSPDEVPSSALETSSTLPSPPRHYRQAPRCQLPLNPASPNTTCSTPSSPTSTLLLLHHPARGCWFHSQPLFSRSNKYQSFEHCTLLSLLGSDPQGTPSSCYLLTAPLSPLHGKTDIMMLGPTISDLCRRAIGPKS